MISASIGTGANEYLLVNTHRASTPHRANPAATRRPRTLLVGLAASVALFAACGSDAKPSKALEPTKSDTSAEVGVTIKTFQFSPNPAEVKAGSIVVRNDDNTTHTFTSDEAGAFDVSITGPNKSANVTVTAGTYKFHCEIHPSMTGELVVT